VGTKQRLRPTTAVPISYGCSGWCHFGVSGVTSEYMERTGIEPATPCLQSLGSGVPTPTFGRDPLGDVGVVPPWPAPKSAFVGPKP
jgi:hypothetical protein